MSIPFVWQLILLVRVSFGQLTSDVDRLMSDLFNGSTYNRVLRPVVDISTVTKVNVSLQLFSVYTLDVTSGKIKVRGVFSISWRDEFLAWDPRDYGGVASLSLPPGYAWTPQIAVSQGAIDGAAALENSNAIPMWVYSDGEVQMFPTGEIQSACLVDTSLYPFDSHECRFTLTSGRYSVKEVLLQPNELGIGLRYFEENTEWYVESMQSGVLVDSCMDMPYVTKRLKVTRRPAFVILHTFVPEMFISLLNLATCFVPFDSGERLSFSITIFMSFVFLSGTIVQELPRNSIVISFTSFTIVLLNIMNVVLVLWSIVVVRVSRWTNKDCKMPKAIVRILSHRARRSTKDHGKTSEDGRSDSEEEKELEKREPLDDDDDEKVSWYHFALLMDKIQFVILVSLTITMYSMEMIILKINNVY